MKRFILINPNSQKGAVGRKLPALKAELHAKWPTAKIFVSSAQIEATQQIQTVLEQQSCDQILVVGGDGTINQAVNAYFKDGRVSNSKIPLGVIQAGTGGDFYKTLLKTSSDYEQAIQANRFALIDCGQLTVAETSQYFINIALVGLSGCMTASLAQSKIPSYLFHTLKVGIRYQGPAVTIRYQATPSTQFKTIKTKLFNMFVCNGRYSGKGMQWSPHSDIRDGLLDVLIVPMLPKIQLLMKQRKIYQGEIANEKELQLIKACEIHLESAEPLSGESDGEYYQAAPKERIVYKILPACMPMIL